MNKTLLILFLPIILFAQDYLWPTNASTYLTSSFCEYRPGHYHSAIDIKTWNTEGYRIFAVDDGQVERIRVSPFGYGKVLYLKLKDGRTAVYAHLQRFNKKLEKAIRQQQLKKKRYSISWRPKNWQVKRGEILGYTGQTGIGVPHLHFEIRDSKEQPLNPLHFYDVIQDHIAPTLQAILITPMDADSRVNGSFEKQEFPLKSLGKSNYKIKQPIRANGKIGLAIQGYDKADKIYNRFAFYRTTLEVDGKQVFQIQYDTLNFDVTKQMDIEIDFPVYRKTKKRFQKLYLQPFNQLPFYKRNLGDGFIRVEQDSIPFKIEVFDFAGNQSTIRGMLVPDYSTRVKIDFNRRQADDVYLKITLPRCLQGLQFFSRAENQPWTDIKYFEILNQTFKDGWQTLALKIRLHQSVANELKFKAFLPGKIMVESTLPVSEKDSSTAQIQISNHGKHLLVKTKPQKPYAELVLDNGLNQSTRYIFNPEVVIPARAILSDSIRLILNTAGRIMEDSLFSFYMLKPGEQQKFSFFNDRYNLVSNKASVYDTLIFQTEEIAIQADSFDAPVFGSILHVDGQAQVLKNSLVLKIKCDSLTLPARQVGISRVNKKGGLSWKSSNWDSLRGEFSTRISGFGKYILSADTSAPFVEMKHPQNRQVLKQLKSIQFEMDDSLSGIGSDKNISVLLDGQFIIPEWDPERNMVIGKPNQKLKPGNHLLEILVSDVAGNVTKKHIRFEIKSSPLKKGD